MHVQATQDYFANLLRQIMRSRGLKKQIDLARLVGVTPPHVAAWLNPKTMKDLPGDEKLPLLAELSEIPLEDLRLTKETIKLHEKGIDLSKLKRSGPPLTSDQEAVLGLMTKGDYLSAAQHLLELMRK